jgi:glc operon protein GlcG
MTTPTQPQGSQPAAPSSGDLPYGAPISLSDAKAVLLAAQLEANANNFKVSVSVVDSGGHLVAFERLDAAPYASVDVSAAKARTAVGFRRMSKAIQDMVAAGGDGLRMLGLPGAVPIDGGVPITMGGRIIGAIGVSGVTSAQDGQIARAGAAALK